MTNRSGYHFADTNQLVAGDTASTNYTIIATNSITATWITDRLSQQAGTNIFTASAMTYLEGLRQVTTNSTFYVSGAAGAQFQILTTNGTQLVGVTNNLITLNTNTVVNGLFTINSPTNTDTIINEWTTGWLNIGGAETNRTILGPGFLAIDANGGRSAGAFGSGLTFSGGTLTASATGYSNITENAYQVNIRSNVVAGSTMMSSNSTGTATVGPGYIALTGTNGQPSQLSMFNGNTNLTLFFDGTNLYTSIFLSTNSGGLSLQTALNNTTNEALRQAQSVTNGAITQLTNYVNTVSQNLTNIAATMEHGSTGNQGIPANSSAFYALNGNGITNLMTSDISTFTRSLMTSKTKIGPFITKCSGNPGAFANKIEVFTNGVLSSITIAINNVTSGVDSTHTETVIAGVEVGVKITQATSSTPVKWSWGLEERIVP
jgi:hypothetical protein